MISVSTENLDQDISEIVETKRISIETLNDILDDNEEEEVHTNDGSITTWYSRFQTHKCYNLKIENICSTLNGLYFANIKSFGS